MIVTLTTDQKSVGRSGPALPRRPGAGACKSRWGVAPSRARPAGRGCPRNVRRALGRVELRTVLPGQVSAEFFHPTSTVLAFQPLCTDGSGNRRARNFEGAAGGRGGGR